MFAKENVNHVPYESGIDDEEECNKLMKGLLHLLEIVSG